MFARVALVWAAFLLTSACGAGEPGDYLIGVWSGEDGLPSSSVTAVNQTPDGYLWVATYNGLSRFDGKRFVNFDPENTPALRHARLRRLEVDASGTLWISTHDGSLISYRDGHFELEWVGAGLPDTPVNLVCARSNLTVFALATGELIRRRPGGVGTNSWDLLTPPGAALGELSAADGQGVIWCRARDQKLWRLVGDEFSPVPIAGLPGQTIYALSPDEQGRIWVGTEQGMAMWDGTRFVDMTPTNQGPVTRVWAIHFLPNGDGWVVADERVRKFHGREWVSEAKECRGVFTGKLDRMGMHTDKTGDLWIYDYGRGIYHVRKDGAVRRLAADDNFPGERVDCFFEDREGNFWAGVDRGGLVRLREKRFTVLSPGVAAAEQAAVTVAEDADGAMWLGTFGGGLHRWAGGEWQNFPLPGGSRRGFVFSVYPDADGRMWLSAGDEDLYVREKEQVRLVTPAVHGVKALLVGRDGKLWMGTKSGLGYLGQGRFHPQEGVSRTTEVRAMAEDKTGALWAGSGNGTLYRVTSNHVDFFNATDQWAQQPVWSLCVDGDGAVWVGTFRGGLLRFKNGKFTRYTSKAGLPDDVICQILDDEEGNLWIGSQRGIFRVAKSELNSFADQKIKSLNCKAYGRYDGLPSVECSGSYQPAAWRAGDGRLYFTTLKGVVVVQPEELAVNRQQPPVVIEEALVDGEIKEFDRKVQRTGVKAGEEFAILEFPSGSRQLELHYTGLSFVSPDRVRFRYKLDGLDTDWVEAGSRRTVQYSFLRPGRYTFRVVACNNDGVWNEQGATLMLRVSPRFYEEAWFAVLVGFVIIGSGVLVIRQFVVRKMRRALEYIERQRAVERDRTRIARDIHDDLGAGLTHISMLSEIARRSPSEELGGHLGQISEMARELTRTMDEIVWAVDPKNDSLDSLITYLSKLAQDYLSVAGIRCRLDVPAQMPQWILRAEVRHNLFLAFKETLNNIIKHSGATEVWLRLSLTDEKFVVTLEDNGRGLAEGGKGDSERGLRISSGHGLGNLEKRLAASGGQCVVTSEPGQGMRVEFILHGNSKSSPEMATGKPA